MEEYMKNRKNNPEPEIRVFLSKQITFFQKKNVSFSRIITIKCKISEKERFLL